MHVGCSLPFALRVVPRVMSLRACVQFLDSLPTIKIRTGGSLLDRGCRRDIYRLLV